MSFVEKWMDWKSLCKMKRGRLRNQMPHFLSYVEPRFYVIENLKWVSITAASHASSVGDALFCTPLGRQKRSPAF